MTDHGILFKGRLVRAILADEKTETRRVGPNAHRWLKAEAGDLLWVRETWGVTEQDPPRIVFRADYGGYQDSAAEVGVHAWRPSIHLAKVNSRLHLELKEKPWKEPLQAMQHDNFLAEGIDRTNSSVGWIVQERFQRLWDSVNEERGYGWKANPEVVVLRFNRLPFRNGGGA